MCSSATSASPDGSGLDLIRLPRGIAEILGIPRLTGFGMQEDIRQSREVAQFT